MSRIYNSAALSTSRTATGSSAPSASDKTKALNAAAATATTTSTQQQLTSNNASAAKPILTPTLQQTATTTTTASSSSTPSTQKLYTLKSASDSSHTTFNLTGSYTYVYVEKEKCNSARFHSLTLSRFLLLFC